MSAKAETAPKTSSGTPFRLAAGGMLQRKCACGGSAGFSGQCAECQKKHMNGKPLQTKLAISEPADVYEQDAGRVADQVMRMSPPEMSRKQNGNRAQPLVQRRVSGGEAGLSGAPPIVHEVLNSPGQPLDPATRDIFEPCYGHDFSKVRVHTDGKAADSARVVNALAYTVGQDVVFRAGQYALGTMKGQLLLAHELAHVVQQSGTGGVHSGEAHEAEAHLAADAVASDRTPSVALAARPSIARAPHNDRAFGGEQGMGFRQYSQQQGWQIIEGPSGAGGHNANASGFDAIAYNPNLDELHIVDNKSFKRAGNVASATAIDPARNLAKNLDDAINRITGVQDIPNRIRVLELLRAARGALIGGTAIPPKVRLVVTGIGGNSSGLTAALRARGVEFIPEGVPTPLPGSTSTNGPPAGGTQTPNSGTGNTLPPVSNTPEVPPNTGAAPKSNTPSTTAPAQVVPKGAPGATRGAPRAFRMGMSAAKFIGPMILDMLNRYYMAKEEHARAVAAIEASLDNTDVTSKIDQLIEQNRLDIARRQHRGSTVYATVAVKVDFTNDVMNKLVLRNVHLSYFDESSFIWTIMSHDGLTNTENKVWYVENSLPLDKVEVSKSESTQFDIDEIDEKANTSSIESEEMDRLNRRRNALTTRLRQEQRDEAAEKKRQFESPTVIPDEKKRAQQQQEIVDTLQKMKPAAAAPAPVPKGQGSGATSPRSFLPPVQQQPAGPSLLAPNDGPIQIAAKKVDEARTWAQRLEEKGIELRARQSTANPPSEAERQAFFTEEQQFRLAIKYWMNYFKNNSREEAVNGLGELIDRVGAKLAELRTHLGG
jgi:flagellar motility protein MotE (MotC chaperone)